MSNLAVVIAVSEYADQNPLPACKNDGVAIAHLLRETGRFDQVLVIDEDTNSAAVKGKLSAYIKENKGPVDEFFFYFSGHGDFDGADFQYILSDFNERKRKQTSLSNEELDGMVRAVAPKLYVKIVDACHSGVAYIKGPEELGEHLKSVKAGLSSVYFMFSSQNNQYSYQDEKISYFTDSFVRSVIDHPSDSIRYKDVMSFVSDDFENRGVQTPVFVAQAALTEVFCDITAELREELTKYAQVVVEENDTAENLSKVAPPASVLDAIAQDARRFFSRDKAMESVSELENILTEATLDSDTSALFDLSIHIEQTNPPSEEYIGRWLRSAKDHAYFARPTVETETYQKRVMKSGLALNLVQFSSSLWGTDNDELYKWVDAQREVVTGFRFSTDMPYGHIRLRLNPKFPNIAPEEAYVVVIVSRTHMRVFFAFSHFEHVDWDKSRRSGNLEWTGEEVVLQDHDALNRIAEQIFSKFVAFAYEPIKIRWGGGSTEDKEPI